MDWQRESNSVDAAPPWCGASLSAEDAALSPMVQLLKVLASASAAPDGTPTAHLRPEMGHLSTPPSLPTFTYSHECALLREPWPSAVRTASGAAVFARPCLFGRACQVCDGGAAAPIPPNEFIARTRRRA